MTAAEVPPFPGSPHPTAHDLTPVERNSAEVVRRQQGYLVNLPLLDSDSADLVRVELAALAERKRSLEADREMILTQRQQWEAARGMLADLEQWRQRVASRLGS